MAVTSPFTGTPTPNYITGNVVAVKFGDKHAYCMSGNSSEEAKVIIRTNSRSGGFEEIRFGNKKMSGTLTLAYNGDEPPNIAVGTFGQLIIDTSGYVVELAAANVIPGSPATTTTPKGEVITVNAGVTKVDRSWNADSGDYSWVVSFQSSGAYTVAVAVDSTTGPVVP